MPHCRRGEAIERLRLRGATLMPWGPLPSDYAERVYAGVLGKIIGVYAGRPFEQWPQKAIEAKFGEIDRYVADEAGVPLIVADDDISGTFTFLRAIDDYKLTEPDPAAVAKVWRDYIIENQTILWWGGVGVSAEHTAFLNLKAGMTAPESGSIARNGKIMAEQIGAQIFIDGWGLICPNAPAEAAAWADAAGRVSHDGEAVQGARAVAAMVAAAFCSPSIDDLIEIALSVVDPNCLIHQVIRDVRDWFHAGLSWREGLVKIQTQYGYDVFPGGCHIVPNHALVIHALLHSNGSLSEGMRVVNTCGYDTDCNAANVGCILGVRNGLAGFVDGYDWRTPVNDRLFLPTADGGGCISDAVIEARKVIESAFAIRGEAPMGNLPRFGFDFLGSTQGFSAFGDAQVQHAAGLRIVARQGGATTPTFLQPANLSSGGYSLVACPTLHSGQTISAKVVANNPSTASIAIQFAGEDDSVQFWQGPSQTIAAHESADWVLVCPDFNGAPILGIGLNISGDVTLKSLDWNGVPTATFKATESGNYWHHAWVNSMDAWHRWDRAKPFHLVKNAGTGMLYQGSQDWSDYAVSATGTSNLAEEFGLVIGVRGLQRFAAVLVKRSGAVELVEENHGRKVIATGSIPYELGDAMTFQLSQIGNQLIATVNGVELKGFLDQEISGAAGFLVTTGTASFGPLEIAPIK